MVDGSSSVTVEELVEARAHLGHKKSKWNPKMKPYIFGERNGIHIIDLSQTVKQINCALELVCSLAKEHKRVLFVGTKKQARGVVAECAERCGDFYVAKRWLGGTLTNLKTIRKSIKTLEKVETQLESGSTALTKKELSLLLKKKKKLEETLSGVRSMRRLPHLLVVVDPLWEWIAVKEARKLGIPVLGIVDTDCDPTLVDWPIVCNDDSLKGIRLVVSLIARAISENRPARGDELVKKYMGDDNVESSPSDAGVLDSEQASSEGKGSKEDGGGGS